MDYLSHNIAINLKRIRKAKGMSLDVVAEQTGVSQWYQDILSKSYKSKNSLKSYRFPRIISTASRTGA